MSMFHELMMRKKEQIMYATIKGSLTENDGVFSGFSASNYLALQQPFKLNADTVAEFKVKINLTSNTTLSGIIGTPNSYGMNFVSGSDSKLTLYLGNGSSWNVLNAKKGTTNLQSNTDYYIRLLINKGNITLLLSTDDITYTTEFTTVITISEEYIYDLSFGRARGTDQYTRGSIDLPKSYIKLGSTKYKLQAVVGYTIVGSPTIVDGVVSGFSSSDYLQINNFTQDAYDKYLTNSEIVVKVKTTSKTDEQILSIPAGGSYSGFMIRNSNLILWQLNGTTYRVSKSNVFQANVDFYIKGTIQNNIATLSYSTDGINFEILNSLDISEMPKPTLNYNFLRLGIVYSNINPFVDGSIDLKGTYIKLDNKLWFNGQQA